MCVQSSTKNCSRQSWKANLTRTNLSAASDMVHKEVARERPKNTSGNENSVCYGMKASECDLRGEPHANSLPQQVVLRVKNSFAHFTLLDEEESSSKQSRLRRHSEPSLLRSSQQNHAAARCITFGTCTQDMLSEESSHQLPTSGDKELSEEDTISSPAPEDVCQGQALGNKGNTKQLKTRICKAKRLKFKKFVMQLHEQIQADPEGCTLDNIEWPLALLDNKLDGIRTKVVANLATYRNDCLAEVSNKVASLMPPCY